jgi:hypothetical protein
MRQIGFREMLRRCSISRGEGGDADFEFTAAACEVGKQWQLSLAALHMVCAAPPSPRPWHLAGERGPIYFQARPIRQFGEHLMTNPEAETFVDDRKSCTVQEAVAKLIGWMRGETRLRVIRMNDDFGLVEEDLPFLHSLEGTVQDMLERQWEAAQRAIRRVAASGAPGEQIDEAIARRDDVDELKQLAETYLYDIEDEIMQGTSSELELDEFAEAKTGEIHVKLPSLEKWAHAKYGISIADALDNSDKTLPKRELSESQKLQQKGWISPTKGDSLLTTFAFLVDAFADSRNIYRSKTGELLESNIAIELAEMAKKANGDIYLAGQRNGAILDRIEHAIRTRRSQLSKRKRQ